MKPRELLGTAQVPGGEELRLYKRDTDFIIALGPNELMSSRLSGPEEALALLTCDRLQNTEAPHLLIGGYGMGFTLRAALARLGPQAKFTVVELIPEIIEWARGPMAELAASCLDDPRVELIMRDVSRAIAAMDSMLSATAALAVRCRSVASAISSRPRPTSATTSVPFSPASLAGAELCKVLTSWYTLVGRQRASQE